jgi:hypothetical protein
MAVDSYASKFYRNVQTRFALKNLQVGQKTWSMLFEPSTKKFYHHIIVISSETMIALADKLNGRPRRARQGRTEKDVTGQRRHTHTLKK